jgi:putative hemolysin
MGEILVILALVLVNGLLSGAEIAIVSIRRSRLEELVREGRPAAVAARRLREQPERFLATVQVGITVAGAAAAAFGGASLAEDLVPYFAELPALGRWAEGLAFATVVGFVTYLSVVLGELVPKSIGLRVSERYALLAAPPLLALSQLARPIVWLLTASSNLVLRLFGDHTTFTEARLSQEELRTMMIDAARQGAMASAVSDIATRALDFGELHASDVMIHRRFVVALPRAASPENVRETFLKHGHQRLPVYEGTIDNVVGYLTWRDVLAAVWQGTFTTLEALLRPTYFAPESMPAVELLRELRQRRTHLAIVVDEHGGVEGLVTLEDLLEELVGEIHSEHTVPVAAMVLREPAGTFMVHGHAPLRDVIRETGLALEEPEDVSTLSGLCVQLNDERVPPVGQILRSSGIELEILDASPRRVRSVRLRRVEVPVPADGPRA